MFAFHTSVWYYNFILFILRDILWEDVHMSYGKISAKQEEILEYIKSQILERGFPPAVREIC